MFKRFLALLTLTVLLTACTVDASEGLVEMTFNRDTPLSDSIIVDVPMGVTEVEFIVEAQFTLGSFTVFVRDPQGEFYVLAQGITDSSKVMIIEDPLSGPWTVEFHVDGNSDNVVDGEMRLAVRKQEEFSTK